MTTLLKIFLYIKSVLLLFCVISCKTPHIPNKCREIPTQLNIDILQLIGNWQVIEVLEHSKLSNPLPLPCTTIDINYINERIVLTNTGNSRTETYEADISELCFWNVRYIQSDFSSTSESSSINVVLPLTISVVRSTENITFLTYCSKKQFFTLVLSKKTPVNDTEIQNIQNTLKKNGIRIKHTNKGICYNASNISNSQLVLLFLVIMIRFLIVSR